MSGSSLRIDRLPFLSARKDAKPPFSIFSPFFVLTQKMSPCRIKQAATILFSKLTQSTLRLPNVECLLLPCLEKRIRQEKHSNLHKQGHLVFRNALCWVWSLLPFLWKKCWVAEIQAMLAGMSGCLQVACRWVKLKGKEKILLEVPKEKGCNEVTYKLQIEGPK